MFSHVDKSRCDVVVYPRETLFRHISSEVCFFIEVKIMRKFISFLLCFSLFTLIGCTKKAEQPEQPIPLEPIETITDSEIVQTVESEPTYNYGVYEVKICERILYNNSVGTDWHTVYSCDDSYITSGQRWTVPLDTTKTITIDATITENDKWPDISTSILSVVLSDAFETSTSITVTENKGRYKGNTAVWEITCQVELVDKLQQYK